MESNANSVAKGDDKKPIPFGTAAIDMSWLFSSDEKNLLVTIKCGQKDDIKTFTVFKPILTKYSKFFDKCLGNPCKEAASSTIELPEVRPGLMMLYLTLANRQALVNCKSTETLVKREDFAVPNAIKSHVRFYQLCDFLQNDGLVKGVREMFVGYIKSRSRLQDENAAPNFINAYGGAFNILEPDHVDQAKLRRVLVKNFCRIISHSVHFKHFSILQEYPDFLMEVSKQRVLNAMWHDPTQRSIADNTKTQRMLIDDESEPEQ
ncbi:hypothetical protein K4K58_011848 [Colletotrichum sp. SAR11_239]|nr:hypothetical protein K4K58_011848 [Colletotrichum sp. SAR11_239]